MWRGSTYTVESVTAGHPDKVCDQISDAILDACLEQDSRSRVAVECLGGHGKLYIVGEVACRSEIDYSGIARKVYADIGYTDELDIQVNVVRQSQDIAQGVDTGGAGDQGIMYGYACNETPEFLPRALVQVHRLTRGLDELRKSHGISWSGPDGKAQITVSDGEVSAVLVSTQHIPTIQWRTMQADIYAQLFREYVPELELNPTKVLINPTGAFVSGGFAADTGLTGRKIMVDTYGGLAPHGGGAFSGKDATKVDRSAAYMARYVAKNIVAAGHAPECLVSVAYAIGRAEPLMVAARDGAGNDLSPLARAYDFRPQAIIERLGLRRPIFRQTAAYGHFGREGLPWEGINGSSYEPFPPKTASGASPLSSLSS